MTIRSSSFLATCVLAAACGGRTSEPGSAQLEAGDGDHDGSAQNEGGVAPSEASASTCVAASGYALCGGPNDCFPVADQGKGSACWSCDPYYGYDMVLCANAVIPGGPQAGLASDGEVYVEAIAPGAWETVPFDVGELFAANGAGDRVRYADWSAWTGAPLPDPTACPQFGSFSTCGGACLPCPVELTCTGRSPLHMYGLCADASSNQSFCDAAQGWSCPQGDACMVFEVSSEDQSYADAAGICFPTSVCQSIASQYPGGAYCHTG